MLKYECILSLTLACFKLMRFGANFAWTIGISQWVLIMLFKFMGPCSTLGLRPWVFCGDCANFGWAPIWAATFIRTSSIPQHCWSSACFVILGILALELQTCSHEPKQEYMRIIEPMYLLVAEMPRTHLMAGVIPTLSCPQCLCVGQ